MFFQRNRQLDSLSSPRRIMDNFSNLLTEILECLLLNVYGRDVVLAGEPVSLRAKRAPAISRLFVTCDSPILFGDIGD